MKSIAVLLALLSATPAFAYYIRVHDMAKSDGVMMSPGLEFRGNKASVGLERYLGDSRYLGKITADLETNKLRWESEGVTAPVKASDSCDTQPFGNEPEMPFSKWLVEGICPISDDLAVVMPFHRSSVLVDWHFKILAQFSYDDPMMPKANPVKTEKGNLLVGSENKLYLYDLKGNLLKKKRLFFYFKSFGDLHRIIPLGANKYLAVATDVSTPAMEWDVECGNSTHETSVALIELFE